MPSFSHYAAFAIYIICLIVDMRQLTPAPLRLRSLLLAAAIYAAAIAPLR